jgi:alkyl sulfatase BDS1-like metallo-beta-lactamase superfamily hydrolase
MAYEHFHELGKMPSPATVAHRARVKEQLPFDDDRDFAEARRGFIAAPEYRQIMAEAGHVAWNIGAYDFLLSGDDFDSIHPSLQRQAILNMEYGLFEVLPDRIYQVRGPGQYLVHQVRHRLDRLRSADSHRNSRSRAGFHQRAAGRASRRGRRVLALPW